MTMLQHFHGCDTLPILGGVRNVLQIRYALYAQCSGAPNDGLLRNALKTIFRLFRVLLDL